jgi:ribosome-associated protein
VASPARSAKPTAPAGASKSVIVNELDLEKKPRKRPRVDTSLASDSARQVAISVAASALDKKASAVEIIEVAGKVDYTDFLVLMSGRSDRHVAALSNAIDDALRKKNVRPLAIEGQQRSIWIVMDYRDVVVHIFQEEARNLYDLDGLWIDARRVSVPMPTREGVPAMSDA